MGLPTFFRAALLHHRGPFGGSCWAYFGADNVDLLAEPGGPGERTLAGIARFLQRSCVLHNLVTEHRLLHAGELLRTHVTQQVQRHRLVFMPGLLIGHNVAIGDDRLAQESRLCEDYAKRFAKSPALLWYLNGDYVLDPARHATDVRALWNRWLAASYTDRTHWRETWGDSAAGLTWGDLNFPPPDSGRWDDPAAVDRATFVEWLTRRWNSSHVAAVRRHDPVHAITSEYYSTPIGGIDLPRTIDGQDVANVGFFDRPGTDLENLPLRLALNDLRLRGKGVSLGEYGVKTHPAWSNANGGQDYHLVRTPEEQRRLFMVHRSWLARLSVRDSFTS